MKRKILKLSVIAVLLFLYLLVFWKINYRSAGDPDMLVCSGLDEYALYPYVLRLLVMFSRGDYLGMLDHQQYSYGYLHYLISVLTILPHYIVNGFDQVSSRSDIHSLRMLSPIFYFLGCLLIANIWSRDKGDLYFWTLLVFLLLVPASFLNNTWWHPDALQFLLVSSTIYLLGRDNYRMGPFLYASAATIAFSICVKTLGLIFVAILPLYFLVAKRINSIDGVDISKRITIFLFILVASYFVAYPSVMIPGVIDGMLKFAAEEKVRQQGDRSDEVFWTRPITYYSAVVPLYYSWCGFSVLIAISLCKWIVSKQYDALRTITVVWGVVHILFVSFFLKKAAYYLVPSLVLLFPFVWDFIYSEYKKNNKLARLAVVSSVIVISYQLVLSVKHDNQLYKSLMSEEEFCPSLISYRALIGNGILRQRSGFPVKVVKDVGIYTPRSNDYVAFYKWGDTDYEIVNGVDPDILLLYKSKSKGGRAGIHLDAVNGAIPNYRMIYSDDFLMALEKAK